MTIATKEESYYRLASDILRMKIVNVHDAVKLTGLSRNEVIDFVIKNDYLRLYDEINEVWYNESTEGHC